MPTKEETAAKAAEIKAAREAEAAKVEERRAALAPAAVAREAQRKAIGDVHGHAKTAMERLRASHREREEREAREGEDE